MFFAQLAKSHAVLPACLLELAMARIFHKYPPQLQSFRVVAFAFLTPFFFLKGGMNISVPAVAANVGLAALLCWGPSSCPRSRASTPWRAATSRATPGARRS
jgi:Kef-type K+ transport system membrane component KefB